MTPYDAFETYRMLARARASSWWPRERFRPWQEACLKRLLRHAYAQVPLYRKLYDEAGFQPEHFRSLDDLPRIPPLSKARLKAAAPEDIVARNADKATLSRTSTSGSTGEPVRFPLGPHERRWQRVTAWRILFEHGYRWTDRTLHFRPGGGDHFWIQKLGIAAKDWIRWDDAPETAARCLARWQHQALILAPSDLYALLKTVARLGLSVRPPRVIFVTGETLLPSTRALSKHVLGTEPTDVYGLVETSDFAWQCERFAGFHASADSHIVEVDAAAGEAGPITVTDLGKYAFPFIRYETGDAGIAATEPCPCGRSLPMLQAIHGRLIDSVLLPDGRRLLWPVFTLALDEFADVQQWRVLQDAAGSVRVQVVAPDKGSGLLDAIARGLRQYVPAEVPLHVEVVAEIPQEPGAKTRLVLSALAPSQNMAA
jgi:phenylacetate-CoA ligase